ncbi:ABC transporter substrate-binding protein [Pseudooceanicola sediminis]|uniref:ABC transporter substrate-binding protein n=1 Tax=Pseudooceanicola sediminis TaxID=2211117 RepID=A0A399J0P7_9RHOB|nr:ABC transporter substrate-binding protein [Pseudooceanicola sediminis]KAA2312100.1 ABC transporter substrate-binding protein [Puniceibacterium sp. HSS470]RII38109.1 ABC transporter substrate-binding protein [Pseudooceanicola sediminis]|tara:strand:+ start:10272 stop:11297 length:1026 start_codon:yes stop_codon:yes gene_type:complete
MLSLLRKLSLGLGLAVLATAGQADPFRIIVTSTETPLVPNSLLYLSAREGYFDRAGVQVTLVPAAQTPMAVAALRAGQGDMANISLDSVISLHREGVEDVIAVHSTDKAIPFVIAGRKDLTLADLPGAVYGIGRLRSLDHDLSSRVLENLGVNVDTLKLVPLGGPSTRAQALMAGRIDATTMSIGSFLAMPDHDRFTLLVDVAGFFKQVPLVSKVDVVNRETLETRGDDVKKVLEALTVAARDYAAHPEKWVDDMAAARPDVSRETLQTLAQTYKESWTVNGGFQFDELLYSARSTQHTYKRENGEDTPFRVEIEDWADFAPMDAVLAKIGTSQLGDKVSR